MQGGGQVVGERLTGRDSINSKQISFFCKVHTYILVPHCPFSYDIVPTIIIAQIKICSEILERSACSAGVKHVYHGEYDSTEKRGPPHARPLVDTPSPPE